MESQLTEALTFPVTSYSQNYFQSVPSDDRFLQNTFQKVKDTLNFWMASADEPKGLNGLHVFISFLKNLKLKSVVYLLFSLCQQVQSMNKQ